MTAIIQEFLSKWHPGQVIAVLAIFAGMCVVLSIVAARRRVRELQLRGDLLRDLERQGRSVEEMERLMCAASSEPSSLASDEEALAELADNLVQLAISGPGIEQIMAAVRAADASTRRTAAEAVSNLTDDEPEEAQVVAVVRGLCGTPRPQEMVLANAPRSASAENRYSEAILSGKVDFPDI